MQPQRKVLYHMNTLSNLTTEYGISESNANRMLRMYVERIGSENGDYEITDITYVGEGNKIVEETCRFCGTKIERRFNGIKNKWSELQRNCPCQKEEKKQMRIIEREYRKRQEEEEIKAFKDGFIGMDLGELTITDHVGDKFRCKCKKCGSYTEIDDHLGRRRYNCPKCHKFVEKYTKDYIGRKYGYLTIIDITLDEKTHKKRFVCKCDCGKSYITKPTWLVQGKIRSCGCYQENRAINADVKVRIRGIYRGMKRRCNNPADKSYYNYGGRGIKICPEWSTFEAFYQWSMENGYDNTKTIDRIDFNGNYEPSNCRWTTYYIQNRNKRPAKRKDA